MIEVMVEDVSPIDIMEGGKKMNQDGAEGIQTINNELEMVLENQHRLT